MINEVFLNTLRLQLVSTSVSVSVSVSVFMYTILRSKPKYNLRKMCIRQPASREQDNRVWKYESLFIVNIN